jgi:hypothetical protein
MISSPGVPADGPDHRLEGRNPYARLYLRCLAWGIATGAGAGALTGAVMLSISGLGDGSVASLLGLSLGGAFYGILFGTLVAVIPSALGAGVVTAVIAWRHPSSPEAVQRDLSAIFVAVVGVLDAVLLVALFFGGKGLSSVVRSVPLIVVANAGVALMLWWARASIARGWLRATG